jgi:hypothetical protein
MSKIAICQPYFVPYMGYFQLINAVDVFVSYDDVNFITRGWIHRNKIKVGGKETFITIPLKNKSQHKKINEISIDWSDRRIVKLMKTIQMSYNKSKYKDEVLAILEQIFESKPDLISELALTSIMSFCRYLDIETCIKVASTETYEKTEDRVENLINICKKEEIFHYINPIGGRSLYDKDEFQSRGVKLNFIQGIGSMSIIDVCMNNSKEEVKDILKDYRLL